MKKNDFLFVRKIGKYFLCLVVLFLVSFCLGILVRDVNRYNYNIAMQCYNSGNYDKAFELFSELGQFSDAEDMSILSNDMYLLDLVEQNIKEEEYDIAVKNLYEIIGNDNNVICAKEKLTYDIALQYFDKGLLEKAKKLFETIKYYEDSQVYLAQIDVRTIEDKKLELYISAKEDFEKGSYSSALFKFQDLIGYADSEYYIDECRALLKRTDRNRTISCGICNSVAITNSGEILYTDTNTKSFIKTAEWDNLISVDTYGEIIVAIDQNNNLYSAGICDSSELKFNREKDCVDVAAGEQFAIALFSDGKVEACGHNDDKQCNVSEWNNFDNKVIDVDAGWRFSVGLTDKGELLFAGVCQNQKKQYLSEKESWKNVVAISASGGGETAVGAKIHGKGHTVGLTKDGKVVAVGDNKYGQCDVSDWTDIVKIATGDWYTVGLKKDGTVLITGENTPGMSYIDPKMFDNLYDDVAAGYGQTIFIKNSSIDAYGFNDNKKREIADSWNDVKCKLYK